jgi:hypothetical protein
LPCASICSTDWKSVKLLSKIFISLERPAAWELGESLVGENLPPELKAAMILFFSLLDERQRRLYAGLEAHKLGYGGDRKVA